MGEEYVVAEGITVSYSGLFKAKDLLREMSEFLLKQDYSKEEIFDEEKVTSNGKNVAMKIEYSKRQSPYIKYIIEVKLTLKGLKEVVVTKGDRKQKYNEGDVEIEISSKLKTDLAGQWKTKPLNVFVGHVINKYLYTIYTSKEISELKSHTNHMRDTIKAFLNLYKM